MTKTTQLKRINRNLAKQIKQRARLLKKLEDQRSIMLARTDELVKLDAKIEAFDLYEPIMSQSIRLVLEKTQCIKAVRAMTGMGLNELPVERR
jgi:ribosomal protein L7/L12